MSGRELDAIISDTVYVTDEVIPQKIGTHDVVITDLVSVSDKLDTTPGVVAITAVSPPRFRDTDSVTITGIGFSNRAGQNEVRLSGTSCTITAESATSITFTVGFLFSIVNDLLVQLEVENLTTGQMSHVWAWIKPSKTTTAAYIVVGAVPDLAEDPNADAAAMAEAQDFERLMTLVDALMRDQTPVAGDILARNSDGVAGVTGGSDGMCLEVDPAQDTNLRWRWCADLVLAYGGTTSAAGVFTLIMNGSMAHTVGGTRHYVADSGIITVLWLRAKRLSGTDTWTLLRILVNGVQQYSSGAISLTTDVAHVADGLNIPVVAGDYIEVEATKTGATGFHQLVGGVGVRV